MPPGGGGSTTTPSTDGGTISAQLAMLVPSFEPGVDDVQVWTGKVELLMLTWPKEKLNELATRLILGCKGTLFLKLQLHKDEIMVGDVKGIKRLVELVGGSWGQIPLEQKFELAEKALYRCNQRADETSDSYLQRCDVLWTELLARKVKLEELQAYILLRGSKLTPDDRKRIIVESGAEAGGVLDIKKVSASIRMLGSGFFGELSGQKRDRQLKVYDQSAFVLDEIEEHEADTYAVFNEDIDEETIETLAAEHDEDASMIVQFEDAVMDTLQSDPELAAFFTSCQEARKRLNDRFKARGFWPVKKSFGKGGKKGKVKSKTKQSLTHRIANSHCRLCGRRGHWKAECPDRADAPKEASAAAAVVFPTSVVTVDDVPTEIAHLPSSTDRSEAARCTVHVACFGLDDSDNGDKHIFGDQKRTWNSQRLAICTRRFSEGLRNRLRYDTHQTEGAAILRRAAPLKHQSQPTENINIHPETCESLFASSGTIGVVDLGASQSVIGSQQVPELLSQLPSHVQNKIKRTECHLVFRFGNHQTLTSRHAMLFPLKQGWFRVAVVDGNTPFLLSSKFLRDTIGAVIDTVEGTMWSKELQRNLIIELSPKNLFLLDINQLWEENDNKGSRKHETFHVQAQIAPCQPETSDRSTSVVKSCAQTDRPMEQQASQLGQQSVYKNHIDEMDSTEIIDRSECVKMNPEAESERQPIDTSGPRHCDELPPTSVVSQDHGQHLSVPKDEGISGSSERHPAGSIAGGDREDVFVGTGKGDSAVWDGQERPEVRGGLQGLWMDGMVREPLREKPEGQSQEVHPLRGVDTRGGSSHREQRESQEVVEGSNDVSSVSQVGTFRSSDLGEGQASGHHRIGVGVRCSEVQPLGGRSGLHESRDTPAWHPDDEHGERDAGDCSTSSTTECQDGIMKTMSNNIREALTQETVVEEPDVDFEFLTETNNQQNYQKELDKLYRMMMKEFKQVQAHAKLFPRQSCRLNLLEVMCSDDSVLTSQVRQGGGRSARFGLSEGDLQQISHRRKLFEQIIRQEPEHLWYSPECGPWCMWSLLNSTKSEQSCANVLEKRWKNLWQISLAMVLFHIQRDAGRHFSIEQPCGSLMLKLPFLDELVQCLSRCCFDMCRLGNLKHPETQEPIRKRLVVHTSSWNMHRSLNGKICKENHQHHHIEGSVAFKGKRIKLSTFTENYPPKFGRQIAKLILQDKSGDIPVYVNDEEEHPTKKRRLGKKANREEIESMFPSINWQTALQIADRTAPRVGIQIVEKGQMIEIISKLCPQHDIHHLVVCRGTDRHVGPSCRIDRGVAPVRRRICIRRRFEDIQVDENWEPWEKLSYNALRRKGVSARVSVTIFARPKVVHEESPVQPSADAPIHERPAAEESNPKRHRVEETPAPVSDPTERPAKTREFVDWTSQKHGPKFLGLSKETQMWLTKIHRNLGHPGAAKLREFCKQVGCPPEVLEAIDHLKCSTCEESKGPTIARPSAIHSQGDFNDCVSMDGVTWTNKNGTRLHFYHFVDHSTSFQSAICAPSRTTESAIQAIVQGWISWAGAPGVLCLDAATQLNAEEFGTFAQKNNICVRTIAADAHWQNSRAERHGGILQEILSKMDIENPIDTYEQLSTALAMATSTKNQWSRYRGFPPEMLVFGKHRKVVGSITSDMQTPAHQLAESECPDGIRFRQELSIRESARKAFAQIDNHQSLRRALLQRTRPQRESYQKGEWVMVWRKRGETQGSWTGPMQVVIQESAQIIWVTRQSKLYRVAPEHVRPITAVEEQEIKTEEKMTAPLIQGVTQYWDLTQSSPPGIPNNENIVQTIPDTPNSSTGNENTDRAPDVAEENRNMSNLGNSEVDQPDQEPSAPSGNTSVAGAEVPDNNGIASSVNIPVPVSDDDELFADHECFHCSADQVWKMEIDINQRDIENWRNEDNPYEMAFLVSASKKQRSEIKLADLNEKDRKLFQEAKEKEIDSWISTDTIARIIRHQIPQQNILRSRWILTWKSVDGEKDDKGNQRTKPKARLVVLGYQDPEVDTIPRDSPTMTKLSRMMILQYAASQQWDIESFDIKTAFLRGQEQGNRVLGMEPPKELREKMKLRENEVVKLLKGAYGRVDAPYLWFMELKKALEELQFIQSPFDPCLFVLRNKANNRTEGMIGVHVDDGLCCGSKYFQEKLTALEQKFPFGSKKKREFTFTGLKITQKEDYAIWVDQSQYVKDISPISIDKQRKINPELVVNEEERQSLRALVGSLQYASVNTRPDISSRLGQLQGLINKAKISTLCEANKVLHETKMHANVTLKIKPIPIEDLRFVAFSDASFASEKNPDSHQGMIIMAAHKDIGNNRKSIINPLVWHSRKIQKVAVSTLSAEAMALAGTTDILSWIRLFWAWINDTNLPWRKADETLLKLPPAFSALPEKAAESPIVGVPKEVQDTMGNKVKTKVDYISTDCKSLYDLVSRTAPPACQEFRTLLQAKLIKEHLENGIQIRWVPSGAQLADALTKVMDSTVLREILRIGAYSLHDESETLRNRADARTRVKWIQQNAEEPQHS